MASYTGPGAGTVTDTRHDPNDGMGFSNVRTGEVNAQDNQMFGYQGQASRNADMVSRSANYANQDQRRQAQAFEDIANRGPQGPSAAELAMKAQSANTMRQNLAMAASGTGPSGASAGINAMNNNAMAQGQLQQQTGMLRAQETQAQQALQLQARQAAANTYNAAAGQQMQGYGQAAQLQTGLGGLNAQMAGTYAGLAQADTQAQLGYDKMTAEREAERRATNMKLAGAGLSAASGMLAMSDIRAKNNIQPAGGDVADAFRPLSAASYGYNDPKYGQGTHFGPMAQELAQTPAGRSAIVEQPNGMMAVDGGRLAMLNASETAQQRRELDGLKQQLGPDGKPSRSKFLTEEQLANHPGFQGFKPLQPGESMVTGPQVTMEDRFGQYQQSTDPGVTAFNKEVAAKEAAAEAAAEEEKSKKKSKVGAFAGGLAKAGEILAS